MPYHKPLFDNLTQIASQPRHNHKYFFATTLTYRNIAIHLQYTSAKEYGIFYFGTITTTIEKVQ